MLDFKINFRWMRTIYVCILAGIIGYWFGIIPALICLLAIIDIRFDDDVFTPNDSGDTPTSNNKRFGPGTG